jgi:O-antigen ligase
LAETGVFALLFFLTFVFLLLKEGFKLIKAKVKNSDIALPLATGIIAILFSMLNCEALYWLVPFYLFWIYCGMLAAITNTEENA